MINGKPKRIVHDNGKQFTSMMFKRFLERNDIKDKPIPNSYPQLQGKVEAYNKIVKNEFLALKTEGKFLRWGFLTLRLPLL
jgi:transposase InsO family protein